MSPSCILLFTTTISICCSTPEGYKVRACTGQEARLNCSSGWYIVDTSAVGGFGPSGTPCTATASCMTNSVQGSLTEVNGNLAAFASNRCNNKQTCNFLIDSNWQSASSYCDSHVYSIIYVDVEYNCHLPTSTAASTTTTTRVTTTSTTTTTTAKTTTTTSSTTVTAAATTTTTMMKNAGVATVDNLSGNNNKYWIWIVVGCVGGVLLIVIIAIIVICVTRKRHRAEADINEATKISKHRQSINIAYLADDDLSNSNGPDIGDGHDGESEAYCYVSTNKLANGAGLTVDVAGSDVNEGTDDVIKAQYDTPRDCYAIVNKTNNNNNKTKRTTSSVATEVTEN